MPGLLETFLWTLVFTNVGLAIFNLIPLPPLDGFNVVQGLLATFRTRWAYEWGDRLDRLAPYGPMLLLAVLALGWFSPLNPLFVIMGPPMEALLGLILG
jgi:Zn-dependent protease